MPLDSAYHTKTDFLYKLNDLKNQGRFTFFLLKKSYYVVIRLTNQSMM